MIKMRKTNKQIVEDLELAIQFVVEAKNRVYDNWQNTPAEHATVDAIDIVLPMLNDTLKQSYMIGW